jgi:hypothetical protein
MASPTALIPIPLRPLSPMDPDMGSMGGSPTQSHRSILRTGAPSPISSIDSPRCTTPGFNLVFDPDSGVMILDLIFKTTEQINAFINQKENLPVRATRLLRLKETKDPSEDSYRIVLKNPDGKLWSVLFKIFPSLSNPIAKKFCEL